MLRPVALAVSLLAVVALAGCTGAAPDPAADDVIRIVASTNVYGDLAQTVAGENVEVTSVIDDPAQDPHQFEANPRVQLALARADIVIVNGGGYDDFMDTMLSASGNDDAVVLDAAELSGKDATADGFNEHVWYDYEAMISLSTAIASAVENVDPSSGDEVRENLLTLTDELQALGASADEAATQIAGTGAIITEPVPLYLLDRMGFENLAPPEFSEAIEEDADIPPTLLQSVLNVIGDGSATIVVYNEQTGGPQTDAVIDVATDNRVPAIGVTETLPQDMSYVGWQNSIQRTILAALDG